MAELELEDDGGKENSPKEKIESTVKAPRPSAKTEGKLKSAMLLYDGSVSEIYKIWLLNLFMTLITLGIYRFWGKTRLRKYVAGSFNLNGDRFEYTGTGKELFMGFMRSIPVLSVFYLPLLLAVYVGGKDSVWPALFILPLFFIYGVARFTATRYRLSRTRWRGLRGFLDGSAVKYGLLSLYRLFLNIVTLSLAVPFSDIALHRSMVNGLYFGNVPVEFEGEPKSLMKTHILTALLAFPTLGLSRFWYRAALTRVKIGGLKAGNISLKSTVTGGNLLKLMIGNILIFVFTFGLGSPVILQRNMKYFARHTKILGDLDTSEILQAKNQKITVGEGLDDLFDMDTGLM